MMFKKNRHLSIFGEIFFIINDSLRVFLYVKLFANTPEAWKCFLKSVSWKMKTSIFHETGLRKRFHASGVLVIDFSHKITPKELFWRIKIFFKKCSWLFFGTSCNLFRNISSIRCAICTIRSTLHKLWSSWIWDTRLRCCLSSYPWRSLQFLAW